MAEKNSGLITCCRYSYPPNSLSLCGPINQQGNLKYYSSEGKPDLGTKEILSQFATLYPYLSLIAYENSIADPFDIRVVEAYWLGNSLLKNVSKSAFARHLSDSINLKKKVNKKELNAILNKLNLETLPHHSFHVLNVYKRTGHLDIPQTIETMDACLINWGKVNQILADKIRIRTQRLAILKNKLIIQKGIERSVKLQGTKESVVGWLKVGDYISYHWGYFCQRLSLSQLRNLNYYTLLSIRLANLY